MATRVRMACLALLVSGCGGSSNGTRAVVNISAPDAVTQYDLFVRDDTAHAVLLHTGWSDATAGGSKNVSQTPFRVGLRLPHDGPYAIAVIGAIGPTSGTKPFIDQSSGKQFYWAGELMVHGDVEANAALLPVDFADDFDQDLFPSLATWTAGAAFPPTLLDCDDTRDFVNPFAKEICGDHIDEDCDGSDLPCDDRDNDGDPDSTDCKPDDPTIHHPILDPMSPHYDPAPESSNCCGYSLGQNGADAHMDLSDKPFCHASSCGDGIDQDCNGVDATCTKDHDCDTFPAAAMQPSSCTAPVNMPPGDDCNDCDVKINPGATETCDGIDNNCNGLTDETCVGCDLDGDTYQRMDPKSNCPDANYLASGKAIDCNDEDAGVFPGSTTMMYPVKSPYLSGPLANCGGSEGPSAACALRGTCRNANPDGTPQDADCDMSPQKGCPTKSCDGDGDGFIDAAKSAQCDPQGMFAPYDCDDTDPHTYPNAPPQCGELSPHNCIAKATCITDADNDGFDINTDCNDNDKTVHPFATELCNAVDDDCDGLTDEGNPDATGMPMVANGKVLGCTDADVGACKAPGGQCVCSSSSIAAEFFAMPRTSCPSETTAIDTGGQASARAARCYFAPQPTPDLCNGIDDDCNPATPDGSVDCPGPQSMGPICCMSGCSDVLTDPQNCSACGMVCPTPPHAAGTCNNGMCGIKGCQMGYADCNKMSADGCEVSTDTDPANCGNCKMACPVPMNAMTASCTMGVCGVGTCKSGFGDCDGKLSNGCEVMTTSDPNNCGMCGMTCSIPNASAKCMNSACAINMCNAGFKDCNMMAADGCEQDVTSDPNNCGNCGMKCGAVANGSGGCVMAKCTVGSCNMGFADCDMMAGNGCEVNLMTDANHCGTCMTNCMMSMTGHLCINGACGCNAKGDCGNTGDGCTNNACTCGNGAACDPATQQCATGKCLKKSGQPCGSGAECASGMCIGQGTCK
jgi:hypothetical protein